VVGVERKDVVVLGGGPCGVAAALAARRLGASVLLVERYGFLGGTATSGLYGSLCGFYTSGPEQVQVVRGIAWEVVELLSSQDALMGPVRSGPMVVLLYDPPTLRLVLDEMVLKEGVELLLHSTVVGVRREGGRLTSVKVCTKSGPLELEGKVFVDATGDADVSSLAGVPVEKAEVLQAGSMMFRVSGVRTEEVIPLLLSGELRERVREAVASGEYDLPREDGNLIPLPREGNFVVGFSRVPVDGTDVRSLTRAELEGRRQVRECLRFLRERILGFENAYLSEIAFHVGVRETRRIKGRHVLTEEEVLSGARFPDPVARGAWPIERHPPHSRTTELRTLEGDSWYQIPYRCCLPLGVENLLVGGRCLSTTSAAQASTRVMAPSMATGQACGTAAALCALQGLPAPELPHEELRRELERGGALL
jgi:glycine/D-amino acid oxidase-like deaminating enzyme